MDKLITKWIQELETAADNRVEVGPVVKPTPVNPLGVAVDGTAPQVAPLSLQGSDLSAAQATTD